MWPLFIALGTVVSAVFVQGILKHHKIEGIRRFLVLGLFLTPAMTIANTETMEYTLSLAFLLGAWWHGERRHFLYAAIFLSIAVGLRLPNLIYGLPLFVLFIQRTNIRIALSFAAITFLLSAFWYVPVYLSYGWDFFNTYSLPYPPLFKVLYKGTVGAWGIMGSIALLGSALFIHWKEVFTALRKPIALPYLTALILSLFIFIALPEKSVFLLPFTLVFGMLLLKFVKKPFGHFTHAVLLLNPILLGTDLVDENRGIPPSEVDYILSAGSQSMGIQLFLPDPGAKRRNKDRFTRELDQQLRTLPPNSVVVTGWWYPMLEVLHVDQPEFYRSRGIEHFYYIDESSMRDAMKAGKSIFYAPEAEIFNIQKYGHALLSRYGQPISQPTPPEL